MPVWYSLVQVCAVVLHSGHFMTISALLQLFVQLFQAKPVACISGRGADGSGVIAHRRENWLRTVSDVDYTRPVGGETLEHHTPHFWQWLDRAAGRDPAKRDIILAALFIVLANRYDWQLFLEVTGPGGSGKSIMAEIATMLAGTDNTTSATIETLESSRERAAVIGYSLIILPDQEKWSGDGAGIKANRRRCGVR